MNINTERDQLMKFIMEQEPSGSIPEFKNPEWVNELGYEIKDLIDKNKIKSIFFDNEGNIQVSKY